MIMTDARAPQGEAVSILARIDDADSTLVRQWLLAVFPYVRTYKSPLDGSMTVTVSLDAPETWANKIFENSRYFRANVDLDGKLSVPSPVSRTHKLRARKVKTLAEVVALLTAYGKAA